MTGVHCHNVTDPNTDPPTVCDAHWPSKTQLRRERREKVSTLKGKGICPRCGGVLHKHDSEAR